MQVIEGYKPKYHLGGENRSTAILVAVSVGSRGAKAHFGLVSEKPAPMGLGWIDLAGKVRKRISDHNRRYKAITFDY